MPEIFFQGHRVQCHNGDNLRQVLMRSKLKLYNGAARWIHCRGMGTCGTCAVEVTGDVSAKTTVEKWRLGFPPHRRGNNLRLACQCKVQGDLQIVKFAGMWGQQVPDTQDGND